jgi:hypothetical protein
MADVEVPERAHAADMAAAVAAMPEEDAVELLD